MDYIVEILQPQMITEFGNPELIIETIANNTINVVGGDMDKTTYDTNFDGIVDTCHYIDCGTFN